MRSALGRDFEAGEGWAYSKTGYLLLRMLLDRVAGFERALREQVFEPLGLSGDGGRALAGGGARALGTTPAGSAIGR